MGTLGQPLTFWCMIKIFRGREEVVDGEEGSSEGCLKWGGGGIFPKTSKNRWWVKAKVVLRGREG